MQAIGPKPKHEVSTTSKPSLSHCTQCGARIETDARRARPTRDIPLCVDCAFDDMPGTD